MPKLASNSSTQATGVGIQVIFARSGWRSFLGLGAGVDHVLPGFEQAGVDLTDHGSEIPDHVLYLFGLERLRNRAGQRIVDLAEIAEKDAFYAQMRGHLAAMVPHGAVVVAGTQWIQWIHLIQGINVFE